MERVRTIGERVRLLRVAQRESPARPHRRLRVAAKVPEIKAHCGVQSAWVSESAMALPLQQWRRWLMRWLSAVASSKKSNVRADHAIVNVHWVSQIRQVMDKA